MPLVIGNAIAHQGYVGGARWYNTVPIQRGATAIAAVDVIYLYPFYLPSAVTMALVGIRSTAGGAGSSAKLGIWANNPTIARPSGAPLIVDNTGIVTTGTGELSFGAGATGALGPGWYWGGTKFTGTLPTIVTVGTAEMWAGYWMGFVAQAAVTTGVISMADAFANSMPTIATNQSWTEATANAPALTFKVA